MTGKIWIGKFQHLEIKVPTAKEQTAIAAILSDMDADMESLEQKRNKYIMLKQGMMQQLLTGKIRLN
ncbi:restriction endonuclease subunit S [bacterium]|nr:restriction endonuclease subunit S [bacterium]